jgi:hypothetical protein
MSNGFGLRIADWHVGNGVFKVKGKREKVKNAVRGLGTGFK